MPRTYNVDVPTDTTLVTTAETVVATLSGVTMSRPGQSIRLHGSVSVTTGATTTALVTRIRQDSLTGALVDEAITDTLAAAAGGTEGHDIVATHSPTGELAGATYVLTVSQTGATGNGACVHASLHAEVTP